MICILSLAKMTWKAGENKTTSELEEVTDYNRLSASTTSSASSATNALICVAFSSIVRLSGPENGDPIPKRDTITTT